MNQEQNKNEDDKLNSLSSGRKACKILFAQSLGYSTIIISGIALLFLASVILVGLYIGDIISVEILEGILILLVLTIAIMLIYYIKKTG